MAAPAMFGVAEWTPEPSTLHKVPELDHDDVNSHTLRPTVLHPDQGVV
jgi:hypothetical protein